jgi:hypothetical protein
MISSCNPGGGELRRRKSLSKNNFAAHFHDSGVGSPGSMPTIRDLCRNRAQWVVYYLQPVGLSRSNYHLPLLLGISGQPGKRLGISGLFKFFPGRSPNQGPGGYQLRKVNLEPLTACRPMRLLVLKRILIKCDTFAWIV